MGDRATRDQLKATGFNGLIYQEYPPMKYAMYPWLPERGIAMIAGWRGIGKTYLGLAVAYAIATGGSVLGWRADRPMRVLYVDGEMDKRELAMRVKQLHTAAQADHNGQPALAETNLAFLSHEDQEFGIPDLSDIGGEGRRALEQVLGEREVLVLDNLSSTCHSGVENDSESWGVVQRWLVGLRRKGKTVVLVHHTGKPNPMTGETTQRGTSKREDILNTSILLQNVKGGGGFKLEFSKVRGFLANQPFQVKILVDAEAGTVRLVRPAMTEEILQLHAEGLTERAIAGRLGISKTTVHRRLTEGAGPDFGLPGPGPEQSSEFAAEIKEYQ